MTALISREGCIFPYSYLEAVLASYDDRYWTFFALCGCPQSLVVPMVQLAHLAAEKQNTSKMRSVIFDMTLVLEMERSLENWAHVSSKTASQSEEAIHQDQDTMHCSEAWRSGLILYIYRVFRWETGSGAPMQIAIRARSIQDHVFACRDDAFVSRQALLPLIFAGCELTDPFSRARITKYCSFWSQRTGYNIFNSAIPLLEEVWAHQTIAGFDNVWWGQIVDRRHMSESDQPLKMRITFG